MIIYINFIMILELDFKKDSVSADNLYLKKFSRDIFMMYKNVKYMLSMLNMHIYV